ncbi:hypothetical protein [Enhygromyxa salina]|uniref:Uncharacterized protein n=1 Tax=Enhygromyxa salina TaxID=215803 RepID=A0A2S9YX33_9BACT|nr:hypothetical protein [Enhygromyxa salina]PRQ09658.1 hypothetical protein ENSA7_07200 [Enhygromyxa salina]
MAEPDKPTKKIPPRTRERKRRGHKAETEAAEAARIEAEANKPKRAVKAVRQLDPEAFKQVDLMIGSFAQRRFGGMMPEVAKAFFAVARGEEAKHPELQQAFALYFVYGYRDGQGLRVLDMFAQHGLQLDREQRRVLDACMRARFVVFGLERKNDANKQLIGRDILRETPMTVLDNVAFAQLSPGDVLGAYMFPVGDLWRPLGMATKVAGARTKALSQALGQLSGAQSLAPIALADRRPAQVFWTLYRVAEHSFRGGPAPKPK